MTVSSTDFGYVLSLEPGDELIRCLIQFARENEVDAAVVSGVGAISELEIGIDPSRGAGESRRRPGDPRRLLTEPLATWALTGTVTLLDGEPFPDLQGSFARTDDSVIGGHVFQAVCASHIEVTVQVERSACPGSDTAAGTLHSTDPHSTDPHSTDRTDT